MVRRIGPARLRASAAANASGSHSSRPPGKLAPALFTRTSSRSERERPNRVDRGRVGHLHLVVSEPVEVGVVLARRPLRVPVTVTVAPASAKRGRHGVPDAAGAAGDQHRRAGEVERDGVVHRSLQPVDRPGEPRSLPEVVRLASSSRTRVAAAATLACPGVVGVDGKDDVGEVERRHRFARTRVGPGRRRPRRRHRPRPPDRARSPTDGTP